MMIYNLRSLFSLSSRPQFLGVYRRDNPRGDVGRTREKLVNHKLKASDFIQVFRVFSQHPRVGYHAGKLIESVAYLFFKITLSFL